MSRTFEIACLGCGVSLWIGQSTARNEYGWYLYQGTTLLLLEKFLSEHMGHKLVFDDSDKIAGLDSKSGEEIRCVNED
jgi:hypothetical protein